MAVYILSYNLRQDGSPATLQVVHKNTEKKTL